jgi:hypothetical protein
MIDHPDIEELEALARGAGTPDAAAHVASCTECAREVAWAKAERALFAHRSQPFVESLWKGIDERIAKSPQDARIAKAATPPALVRKPHWHRRATAAMGAVAAAAAIFFGVRANRHHLQSQVQPQTPAAVAQNQAPAAASPDQPAKARRPQLDPKALAALDTAENDYRHAAQVLEAEYDSLRPQLDPALAKKWDETLTRARTQLAQSRAAVASDDARSRMRVLDGYAEYLRSLRDVIQDSEEATP